MPATLTNQVHITTHALYHFYVPLKLLYHFISVSSDYRSDFSNGGKIVLNADNPTVNVSFTIVDDSIFELSENLSASLTFSNTAHPRVVLSPASVEIIILGDDGKSIILTFL